MLLLGLGLEHGTAKRQIPSLLSANWIWIAVRTSRKIKGVGGSSGSGGRRTTAALSIVPIARA
jgi:hypothetical protein